MTSQKLLWWEQFVPVVIPLTYLQIARERQLDLAEVLRVAGLPADFVQRPHELALYQVHALVEAMLRLGGDYGLGLDMGWRLPPTAFGSFGQALLCSYCLRDALRLCQRYWHLVAQGTVLDIREIEGYYHAQVAPVAPLPAMQHQILMETTLSSVYRGFQVLAPEVVGRLEISFDYPEPAHGARILQFIPSARFSQKQGQLRFPAEILDVLLPMHHPAALAMALQQCEREHALSHHQLPRVLAAVRSYLLFHGAGYPDMEQVSAALHMSCRSLRRHLRAEGSSFKQLLDEARQRDAMHLLADRRLTLSQIAGLLGYQDPANFTRAFRQWTGMTPQHYRLGQLD